MITETNLFQNEIFTYRIRPGKSNKVLLLLHGITGDENSMTIITSKIPEDYWLFFPRAPFSLDRGGYSWREPTAIQGWPAIDFFRKSCLALIEFIETIKTTNNLMFSTFDVCGFSQGGAMTFSLGALFPELVGKMAILSGFAPMGSEKVIVPEQFKDKTIFISHGKIDETVPISMAYDTVTLLENNSAKVIFSESVSGHKMSAPNLNALHDYFLD
ncbi:MAG: hypothetical protein WCP19_02060 [Chloroflexota bacterium]